MTTSLTPELTDPALARPAGRPEFPRATPLPAAPRPDAGAPGATASHPTTATTATTSSTGVTGIRKNTTGSTNAAANATASDSAASTTAAATTANTTPDPTTDIRESATQLHRLAAMASLQDWVRRSSPVLMHEAVLAGESPAEVAAAARLSVAEAHLTWNTWASRRLAASAVTEPLPLRQYLRVHTAFARALTES
ncbi:hypothetical protein VSH64_06150 [Amycolatopsis rhabdoformis]|uniref:Uncharacterized protein n=1 Tax=Amycolatopsis rhabdoformis TaxID=1448059 RepID=A0ABZ1ICC7_9PSEU|nr:hypothetical protein [Amycolatopsis rhabdoformis]WSE31689.1 hypothetical protein VSH64_06150 [Amycolatopsis rhabdoformis]